MKRSSRLWLSLSQLVVALTTAFAFSTWAPWLAAMPPAEALSRYKQPIPPTWRAVVMGHGQLSEFAWGTVASNPWGFTLCTTVVFGGVLFLVLTAWHSSRTSAGRLFGA